MAITHPHAPLYDIYFFVNTIFVSSHMYPENPEGTQVIVGSMNMGYISDTARNQIIWNGFLVADPSVRPPGFELVRSDWVSLNRYRTGHGRCAASLHQWGIQDNPFCSCGSIQTMFHIVDECPLTKFNGGLRALHSADGQAVEWLRKRSAR